MSTNGSKYKTKLSAEHREKIANSRILNNLIDFVEGKREMTKTQVEAANILLKKVLPDLAHAQIESTVQGSMSLNVFTGVPRAAEQLEYQPMHDITNRIIKDTTDDEIDRLLEE
ncbi:hypothetical protein KEU06_15505 [Pseudaminobacter sp. 19-2017]|uniref:Uncharacterized protein n=1 Tax=Pseudaminobacter soli (ex Zhang et al. 2022) TaxID=2831468 RepID=A0A942DXL3_9HYPH|nr:hypothetical protein [Pseudaminobacter soli]MBS3650019.1 hypothetical protein [Pseudaminobacter soli]